MFLTLICLLLLVVLAVYTFMQRPEFGGKPSAAEIASYRKSQGYLGGQFQNLSPTPSLAKDANIASVMYRFFFKKSVRNKPKEALPSEKTDLRNLRPDENALVWFGHSSYFLQMDGKKFLVDPVFSGSASPIPATTKAFTGSDVYSADDMPEIDVLFLTHDHWDHLDYQTVLKLKPKVKQVITGLGTGVHLRSWGYDPAIILEMDWWDHVYLNSGFKIQATPARHFSGRGFKRNGSLWTSFVLETPSRKIFLGGDSGYDFHFAEIGGKLGPFDLAILECGQYNADWRYIHMVPGQWLQAARDLDAKAVLPVHWGKFALALHAWDEPITQISSEFEAGEIPLWTPMIGEKVDFDNRLPFAQWWKGV
ncbi:MBL fold metallo-hydrolase [Flavobacterium selenitireducens]|uniref:MBL fold metallo-hydrolase n=1 Tax=Flavobacterium selenitireducens TaxID=2722704 RepID=UPI00168ABB49|nr:MBL fold metallo-hydrolase [Flavobacterium selenitireducens]MBD3581542.1 MBL fold metallo-hydrolase [Flavobacterium selenitireducens]